MGARVAELSKSAAGRRTADGSVGAAAAADAAQRFHFWRGASGAYYIHTVYSLIECPELPRANYLLVKRDARGRRRVLSVGCTTHEAPSLNLADIRHRGAKLGANEVHVHFLAETERARRVVEFDLHARRGPGCKGASMTAETSAEHH